MVFLSGVSVNVIIKHVDLKLMQQGKAESCSTLRSAIENYSRIVSYFRCEEDWFIWQFQHLCIATASKINEFIGFSNFFSNLVHMKPYRVFLLFGSVFNLPRYLYFTSDSFHRPLIFITTSCAIEWKVDHIRNITLS